MSFFLNLLGKGLYLHQDSQSHGTDLYYRGRYPAQVHGSRDGGVVDTIHLEFPGEIRIHGGKTNRDQLSSEESINIAYTFSFLPYMN